MALRQSVDELLLRTNLLNRLVDVKKELSVITDYANNYISWEKYFENLIRRVTTDKMYKYTHSGELRTCYYNSCSECNPNKRIKCDGFLEGDDKFVSLLNGTKYEFLLDYSIN